MKKATISTQAKVSYEPGKIYYLTPSNIWKKCSMTFGDPDS